MYFIVLLLKQQTCVKNKLTWLVENWIPQNPTEQAGQKITKTKTNIKIEVCNWNTYTTK